MNNLPDSQYAFQHKYLRKMCLNIGCDKDFANLKARGAINLDIRICDLEEKLIPVDVIADATRPLPFSKTFKSIILGDILEHYSDDLVKIIIINAKNCLLKDGYLIITCPEDYRSPEEQLEKHLLEKEYTVSCPSYHMKPMTYERLWKNIDSAGMKIIRYEPFFTDHYIGHGILAI